MKRRSNLKGGFVNNFVVSFGFENSGWSTFRVSLMEFSRAKESAIVIVIYCSITPCA